MKPSIRARELSLEAVLEAAGRAPALRRLATEVAAAEARLLGARTYPYNPEVAVEAGRRENAAGESTTDRGLSLSQRLEIAGQKGHRQDAATRSLAAAQEAFRQARREILAEAARAFAEAVSRRDLLGAQRQEAEIARSAAGMVERRLEAGSATGIDLALARATLSRVERQLALAHGLYRGAQARLAEVAGMGDATLAEPEGSFPPPPPLPQAESLLTAALANRGDLSAARDRVAAAKASHDLERAERFPDLTLGAGVAREEGDDLLTLGAAISLPLFQRNQGAIGEAEAAVIAAESELAMADLAVRREVTAAWARLEAALTASEAVERLGVTPLEEGLALLERAFEAGKIGAAELLLYRHELVEGRRQAVEARWEAWDAAIEVALVAGGGIRGLEWLDRTAGGTGEETE